MNKMMKLVAVLCCTMTTTIVVNAQQAESPIEKGERLAKAADNNPQDWHKQYDAANFYLIPTNDAQDLTKAEKYANRALEIAKSQTVKRDTILGKSFELLTGLYANKSNYEQMMICEDQAIRAYVDELGYMNAAIPPRIAMMASYKYLLFQNGQYGYGDVEAVRSFREAMWLNNQLPEGQRAEGMEDAETAFALSHEMLLLEHINLMKDKVWQWTDKADGRTYTILACHDWTLEQPLGFFTNMIIDGQSGKKSDDFKYGLVLMDDQGKITERKNALFDWYISFNQKDNYYKLSDTSTIRLVRIPADRRQQIIDAFHKFENNK